MAELSGNLLERLSVSGHAAGKKDIAATVQKILDAVLAKGSSLAVFPEGPYCVPV